jgi:hypothetical protein
MELDLDTNLFTGTIPPSIGLLTNLDFLDLSVNDLNGTIPTEIGLLSELEVLILYSNRLTGTVPSSLASLPLSTSDIQSCSHAVWRCWFSHLYIFLVTGTLEIFDNNLTGSLDEFCALVDRERLERFRANSCGQEVEIACGCCTDCCDPETETCTSLSD